MHLLDVGGDVRPTPLVARVGDTVFGDDDGFAEASDALEHVVQACRIDLPAEISARIWRVRTVLWPRPADEGAAVVVDADPIQPSRAAQDDAALPEPVAEVGG